MQRPSSRRGGLRSIPYWRVPGPGRSHTGRHHALAHITGRPGSAAVGRTGTAWRGDAHPRGRVRRPTRSGGSRAGLPAGPNRVGSGTARASRPDRCGRGPHCSAGRRRPRWLRCWARPSVVARGVRWSGESTVRNDDRTTGIVRPAGRRRGRVWRCGPPVDRDRSARRWPVLRRPTGRDQFRYLSSSTELLDFLMVTAVPEQISGDLAGSLPTRPAGSCSRMSKSGIFSCAASTSTATGSVITICSPSFSAADSSAPAAISTRTTEIDEDSQIRLLVTAHAYDHACARVEAVVRALETARRPRALLEARILHARCLAAAGRATDAKRVLIPVTADCAEYGLPRLVADGGEPVTGLLTEIADNQRRGRWQPEWPSIPETFLGQTRPH